MDVKFLLNSASDRPRLRVGLLLDGLKAPRWVAEIIDQMLSSNFVTIGLVVLDESAIVLAPKPKASVSPVRRVARLLADPDRRCNLLYSLYQRWDGRNGDPEVDPRVLVDCSKRLTGVRTIGVRPLVSRFVHRFGQQDLEAIRAEKLDVLVRFGFNILRGDVLSAARYGCWSYYHGDNEFYRGGPAYFWELVEDNPCSGAVLQVLSEKLDDGKILCKGIFATELGTSQVRNRVRPYWGASSFLIQKLRELHLYGWDHLQKQVLPTPAYRGRREIYRAPTNGEMGRWFVKQGLRAVRRHLTKTPRRLRWRLGIRTTDAPLVEGGRGELKSFNWINAPRGHYFADPFIAEEAGRRWVFFEDFDYERQMGTIRFAELRGEEIRDSREALSRPYHLSYPCIFRDSGAWYMIPESATTGRVELFVANPFPGEWRFVRCLLEADAVDSTFWFEDGLYWLFVTRVDPRGNAVQLWLYSSRSLSGDWTAHPANPLSTDVRYARGGGAIFRHKGRLFRPSQDGTIRYGKRLVLNEILDLSVDTYRETVVAEIEPKAGDGLVGVHSYALSGDIEIIDGLSQEGDDDD